MPARREAAALDRRTRYEEIVIVLGLTVLYSVVLSIIDLLTVPLRGSSVATISQTIVLARHVAGVVFGLVPVWLVVHLLRRSEEGPGAIGFRLRPDGDDLALGIGLAVLISAVGLGVYVLAFELGLNRLVIPVPPLGHWWTVPVLILDAAKNGFLEEVVVSGYLLHRLGQAGWSPRKALLATSVLRGSYHLYQGVGGLVGNVALGLLFGWIFQRTRRVWPLIVAHTLVDVLAGLGYILLRDRVAFI
jgi:membrane protease YdiL (CAAX protease family)